METPHTSTPEPSPNPAPRCPRCHCDPDLARWVAKDLLDTAWRLRGTNDQESWIEFVRAYDRLRDALEI
jgi:hypothetical protein